MAAAGRTAAAGSAPGGSTPLSAQYAAAAHALARVLAGESLNVAREAALGALGDPRARAGAQSFLYATLRAYGVAPALLRALLDRRVADGVLTALLHIALVDLRANVPHAHTLVDQSVRAAEALGRTPAKGLVNAVLRNYLRHRDALERGLARDPQARWQHPAWWIDQVRQAYPGAWQRVLEAGNGPPPFCIRVNARMSSVHDYAERLTGTGLASRAAGPDALIVDPPVPVDRLPGFHQGACSVQDAGAQRAARLLGLAAGQRVLDACAAPGGKSAHILECAEVQLTALEVDAGRAARIEENLARLRLGAQVIVGDAKDPAGWWDGRPFERILVDVPCTASGVARRHPDVKWLRRKSDIGQFARTQQDILRGLWPLLARSGKLLYVTCSVFPQENQGVVETLVAALPDARHIPLPELPDGQLLPDPEHDGFYYALIEKRDAA
jgi:16S rRNA (cytosine967-C5)-methyltransferase